MLKAISLGLCGALAATAAVAADDHIGRVKQISGMAQVERGGDAAALGMNAPIFADDRILTGPDGSVGVLFADDTRFAIGPNAETVIDSFIYDPQAGELDMAIDLARGTAAFITGRIGRFSPESVAVRSPVATIGVRGTRFVVSTDDEAMSAVDPETTPEFFAFWPFLNRSVTEVVLLPDDDGGVGAVVVEGRGGAVDLAQANESVRVAAAALAPTVGWADPDGVAAIFGDALAHLPDPASRFTVRFPSGEATLTPAARATIARAANDARARGAVDLAIVGHTDRAGDDAANLALSQERAAAVRDALAGAGVDVSAVPLAFHGENEPVIATADGVAEPRNRRVEIVVR